MGDLAGKNFVVTGANTGIGKVTAEELAKRGARVVLACRSVDKAQPVLDAMKKAHGDDAAVFVKLDLGDFASVRRAADEILADGRPIDVLVNNAGLAGLRGETKDGFELAFGTNHLGHFLLTHLLLPKLLEASSPRIVNVASKAHYDARGIDWDAVRKPTRSVTGLTEYAVSKLANVLFAKECAKRLDPKVKSYSLHPGVVASDVWREVPAVFRGAMKLFMITNEEGAKTTLHCATSPECASDSGKYYDKCKEKRPSRVAEDGALARLLWEKSAGWTGTETA